VDSFRDSEVEIPPEVLLSGFGVRFDAPLSKALDDPPASIISKQARVDEVITFVRSIEGTTTEGHDGAHRCELRRAVVAA